MRAGIALVLLLVAAGCGMPGRRTEVRLFARGSRSDLRRLTHGSQADAYAPAWLP